MEYSGPADLVNIEADPALSDDDLISHEHWPLMPLHKHPHGTTSTPATATPWQPKAVAPHPASLTSTSSKRPMEHASDTSEPSSPAAKTSRHTETTTPLQAPQYSLPHLNLLKPPPPVVVPPAFAPRTEYVKFIFRDTPTVDMKLRWLSEISKTYGLDRELAEIKMSAVTSRFVYISRQRADIVDKVKNVGFGSLFLDVQDSVERPRKFPSYLITRYPVGVDPSLAKELSGIYTVRRFLQNGAPINRLVVTWSLPDPPPSDVNFSFLPCLPPCELRRMKDEQPWCFKCWGIGHISRYCSAPSDKCGWCSANHSSRACPHRIPDVPTTMPTTSSTETSPSAQVKSEWRCPRCHEPGVNVWHGCTKRLRAAASLTATVPPPLQPPPPPPPPPRTRLAAATPPLAASTTDSLQILALREAVATLTARCTAIAARFDAIETRIDTLTKQHATTERTLSTLVESHHVVIASVTTFSEKLEALASRIESFSERLLKEPSQRTPQSCASSPSSPGPRKNKSRFR